MIALAAPRGNAEWIGRTSDDPVPPRVRLRVYVRDKGICQCCGRKLAAGDSHVCDHMVAIINGGLNVESNLQTICGWCDRKVKTPADVAEKARTYRVRARHVGIKKPRTITAWRKFDGTPVRAPRGPMK